MERRVASKSIYRGKLISVRLDTVELASNRQSIREVASHPGAVAVLPVKEDGTLLLVEHFRYPVGKILLEVPAGVCEPEEKPIDTARRELEEETGYRPLALTELCRFFTSPGWSTEEIVLFRAEIGNRSGHGLDHDEILNVVEIERDRIPVLMRDGSIADAKTMIALQIEMTNPWQGSIRQ